MPISFISMGWVLEAGTVEIIDDGEITIELEEDDEIIIQVGTISITMFRGDNKNQKFIVQIGGVPMDISTSALKFTVKKKDTDTTAIFQRKNTNAGGGPSEIEMTDPVNGKFTVKILPSNTVTLEGNVKYWYDIEMTLGGSVRTLIKNRILINTDITT